MSVMRHPMHRLLAAALSFIFRDVRLPALAVFGSLLLTLALFSPALALSQAAAAPAPDPGAASDPSKENAGRAVMRAYLGTIPDYAAEVQGVKLSGVTKGAPADVAGTGRTL